MTRAAARRRTAIAISFGVQAAMIAALLGCAALESTHHVQAVRAVPAAAPQPSAPATTVYPMRLSLLEQVGGGRVYTDELPRGWAVPPYLVHVPPGMAEPVEITVTNPGPASTANVWFAIAPDTSTDFQGTFTGHIFWVKSRVSLLPPGVTRFRFTVPTADLQPGSYPLIVMGAQEGSHQVTYDLIQLDPNGDS